MKAKDFTNGLDAGYGFFYVETSEMERCLASLNEMISKMPGSEEEVNDFGRSVIEWDFEISPDPDAALNMVEEAPPYTVAILKNFDWFFKNPENGQLNYSAVQMLQNRESIYCADETRKAVVIVGNATFDAAIPDALQKQFLALEFGLPEADEIKEAFDFVVNSVSSSPNFVMPEDNEIENIIDSLKGLTISEIKSALSFSLVKHGGKFNTTTLVEIRDKMIEKVAGIKALNVDDLDPEKVKGMGFLKEFALKAMQGTMRHLMKGFMLLGPPGTGKTTFFKWLAKVTGLRLYFVEVAELFGGLVGDSEKLMKGLLNTLPLLAPCIIVFDEIEKALAGMKGGGGDGGTTKRSLGQLLKFMSEDRPKGLLIFATCNDITGLPPEWVRAGRWTTAPWFIDLPDEIEKEGILEYYKALYEVDGKPSNWDGWTGAEIEAVCINAAMLECSIQDAEKTIRPVSKTMEEEISALRVWAEKRTIMATEKLIPNGKAKGKRAVKV